jgi:hypothetical protein
MKRLLWNKVPAAELRRGVRRYLISGSKPRVANMTALGQMRWAIAEGYIPGQSSVSDPALVSHETACILNAGETAAHVRITIFFADREPVGPYVVTVAAHAALTFQRSRAT